MATETVAEGTRDVPNVPLRATSFFHMQKIQKIKMRGRVCNSHRLLLNALFTKLKLFTKMLF